MHLSWRVWLTFWALGIIWGVPYFFIRVVVQDVPPLVVAWARITLAAMILLPIAWQRGALKAVRPHLRAIAVFALVEFVGPFSAICIGERRVGSAVAGILIAGVPLTVTLMSRFFRVHEPLGTRQLCGLIIGFVGVAALVGFGPAANGQGWVGVGCILLATVGYAAGPLIIQRHLAHLESIGPVAASLAIASAVLLLPALLTFPAHLPAAADLASIAVLGVLCTAIAMLLMFSLVAQAGAARASVITYINPLVATLLGAWLLHEHLGTAGLLAFAVILLGSWLATRGAPVATSPASSAAIQ
jgi:drug/metabolite transporter (DMT)-like permease